MFNLNSLKLAPRVNLAARRQDRVKLAVTMPDGATLRMNVGATVVDRYLLADLREEDRDGRRDGDSATLTGAKVRLAAYLCYITSRLHAEGKFNRPFPGTLAMIDYVAAERYYESRSLTERDVDLREALTIWRTSAGIAWDLRREATNARWNDAKRGKRAAERAAEDAAAAAAEAKREARRARAAARRAAPKTERA